MIDNLSRLLELPATAHLIAAGDQVHLFTLTHETADRVIVERRRLGQSVDIGDLLELIGRVGLTEPSQIQVTEIPAPQLPAPVEAAAAPMPSTRRTTKHQAPVLACSSCDRTFANSHALEVHVGRAHKAPKPPAVDPLQARAARRQMEQPAPTIERVSCPQCEKRFDPRGLGPHIAKAHKAAPETPVVPAPEPPAPEPQTFACQECPRTFRSQGALDNHVAMIHWESAAPVTPEPPAERPVPDPEGICDVCRRGIEHHERCADCGMLLGDGHTAGPAHIVINGKSLCSSCDAYRTTASRLVVPV